MHLDMRVITPQGKTVDPKHPSTAVAVNGQIDITAKARVDRDSVRGCVRDGHERENLVWQDAPLPGTYFVYASLYDACGQAAVRFNVSVNQPAPAFRRHTAAHQHLRSNRRTAGCGRQCRHEARALHYRIYGALMHQEAKPC